MSINFQQEWKGLSADEQNAILIATDSYTTHLYSTDISFGDIPQLSTEKMHELTEQYLRGEVTLQGLEAMSNPEYWQKTMPYIENVIPGLMQEYHQESTLSELDQLIQQMSDFAFLDATGQQGNNHALPQLRDTGLSIAG